jgi:hypothetical protein
MRGEDGVWTPPLHERLVERINPDEPTEEAELHRRQALALMSAYDQADRLRHVAAIDGEDWSERKFVEEAVAHYLDWMVGEEPHPHPLQVENERLRTQRDVARRNARMVEERAAQIVADPPPAPRASGGSAS